MSEEVRFTLDKIADRISTQAEQRLKDHMDKVGRGRMFHLEFFAQAFVEETGLKPSECELVEVTENLAVRWFFRRRQA